MSWKWTGAQRSASWARSAALVAVSAAVVSSSAGGASRHAATEPSIATEGYGKWRIALAWPAISPIHFIAARASGELRVTTPRRGIAVGGRALSTDTGVISRAR